MRCAIFLLGFCFALLATPARAAGVMFEVTDHDGHQVANAVIALTPKSGPAEASTAQQLMIDQRREAFIPLVSVLDRGGSVVFKNSDRVRHHVYSFSPIRPFQFVLNPEERSEPVRFEKSGVVAIGCNIHDKMVTYVYVTDTKWTVLTGSDGSGVFASVPKGEYSATIWHPQLKPGEAAPSQAISVGAQPLSLPWAVSLVAAAPMNGHHGSSY